ncbi:MAG: transcription antitermination factor NusB [Candidatus Peribacteraceae bacterium]|nr:transcription antitermination factor NusB [Candidatus Peribacteraceae bacterium]
MARRRHLSRIAVLQVLFESERRSNFNELEALARNAQELGEVDLPFAESLLVGVVERQGELERVIEQHAPEWSLARMDPISRCVLLIGTFELLHRSDVPPAVAMNEAIEIAKEFGTEESGKFVNGVLNAIAQGTGKKEGQKEG